MRDPDGAAGRIDVVLPTPDYQGQEPPHAPVNGQPTLGVPTLSGVILVKIPQCRDIQSRTVVELFGHPEDIEYAQLIPEFVGGAAGG